MIVMDNPPNPATSQSELSDLRAQYQQLQQLVSSILLVLIVISGTLTVFLLRQWRFVKTELDAVTPQAAQVLLNYSNNFAVSQDFAKKLAEYGRAHPDFTPIVNRYRLDALLPKPGAESITSSLPASVPSHK